MTDRVLRDEILESDRWLSLPTDTDRIAFIGLLLQCDDFGNLEGGINRMYRFLEAFTQIKTQESAATTLLHLVDADLIRSYTVDGREFYHLPRLRPHRQYLTRKQPSSPWDDDRMLGKKRRVINKGKAKDKECSNDVATTSLRHSSDVAEGVGVGVGVGVDLKPFASTEISVDANGAWIGITDRDRKVWANAYPAIAVNIELDKAMAWVIANPKNRKKNWRRFLVNWLARSQEKAPTAKPKPSAKENMSWLV